MRYVPAPLDVEQHREEHHEEDHRDSLPEPIERLADPAALHPAMPRWIWIAGGIIVALILLFAIPSGLPSGGRVAGRSSACRGRLSTYLHLLRRA